MHFSAPLIAAVAALLPAVSAHGLFLSVTGSASGSKVVGQGFGTEGASTKGHSTFYQAPRYLTTQPKYATCGVNRRNGGTTYYGINWASLMKTAISKKKVPTVGSDRTVTAKFFQNNRDGAGPFHCEVSTDATGKSWKAAQITQQIPGTKGINAAGAGKYHTLKFRLPSGIKCTGSSGTCLVRCKNPNTNAFGGCMAVKYSPSGSKFKRDSEDVDFELLDERNDTSEEAL